MDRHLIIFTRYPEPHKTKTRLIPALGAEGAAELQREMTLRTLHWAKQLAKTIPVSVEVRFDGGDELRMQECFGDDFPCCPQGPGDLGSRMAHAVQEAFQGGAQRVVVVGTDCPEITLDVVTDAFDRLASCDVVLGPAGDGGYYLIGLQREVPELLTSMPWGTEHVFHETVRRAKELSLSVSCIQTLADVDRPEDLPIWHRLKGTFHTAADQARISIVIPALNEAHHLENTLLALRDAENVETIVVDAGSGDQTAEMAERYGCRLLRSSPGRARQMNAGADAASGSILLFLHADTRLPTGFDTTVRTTLQDSGVAAGAFRLRIDAPGRAFRIIERAVNIRSRFLRMPYGDQALCLRKETFQRLGGFLELLIMEDFEFIRRLRRVGRIQITSLPATTSGRRWRELGPWRTTWINQKVIFGYCVGVSPQRLAQWYHCDRRRPPRTA
ncbi:MAG TPA: TIGR04283 family arsenosugar biosynthesis glycosyltransferase [Thermoguttaceae bacterium]|nr:TIGR04283 family arsenosugar biosynthesis glycosyltransferase [Thermoguttaceae bacterium]